MIEPSVGLNSPAAAAIAAGTVTLVEGGTFCLSDAAGDIRPATPNGLFFRDARVLSRWELRLDGQPGQPLSVHTPEAFTARFVLRRPPPAGQAEATVLVIRERVVSDGLRETITLRNLSGEACAVGVTLDAGADFADLFAVKEGHVPAARPEGPSPGAVAAGDGLVLREGRGGARGVAVSASAGPVLTHGSLTWHAVIPPRGLWAADIVAQPIVRGRRVRPPEPGEPARAIRAWRDGATVIRASCAGLTRVLRRTESDLGVLQIRHDGRRFVAAGAPWYMTLFGRDSLLTAWMALPLDPGLALGTLQTLAARQGRAADPATEEEPGRILHEVRHGPDSARALGGSRYYGTVDATPLFVMLLAECWRWGADAAEIRALLPAADAALSWIGTFGDRDGDGFVEYQRATGRGLINQGWKDSADGINDASGRVASAPVALCEVQGYVYAAWLARADLASGFGDPVTAARCRARAAEIRQRFAESFWLPGRGWYAVALDGGKRPVDALASNVAHCLWTGIAAREHAAVIVERLGAADMDTGYGLRTLAVPMGAYNPMSYHNGSVWPHDTAIAVAGLLRYAHVAGAAALAARLAGGLLDAAAAFGGRLPELYCGFSRDDISPPVPYPTSCSPQAWASAAPLLLLRSLLGLDPDVPRRMLTVCPRLPADWGEVTLDGLRLGPAAVVISAEGRRAAVQGLPDGWQCHTGGGANHEPP